MHAQSSVSCLGKSKGSTDDGCDYHVYVLNSVMPGATRGTVTEHTAMKEETSPHVPPVQLWCLSFATPFLECLPYVEEGRLRWEQILATEHL